MRNEVIPDEIAHANESAFRIPHSEIDPPEASNSNSDLDELDGNLLQRWLDLNA